MRDPLTLGLLLTFLLPVTSQVIFDVVRRILGFAPHFHPIRLLTIGAQWQTTWDWSRLFSNVGTNSFIAFNTPNSSTSADIQIDDNTYFQVMAGHGASLSEFLDLSPVSFRGIDTGHTADSSAKLFNQLKVELCSKLAIFNFR